MILGKDSIAFRIVRWVAIVIAIALAGAVYHVGSQQTETAVQVAEPMPTVPMVETLDGESIRLAEFAPGKRVAIVVMKGTWCGVCTSQLTRLQARSAELPHDAVVVALNADDISTNNRVAASLGLTMQVLSDTDLDVIRTFDLAGPNHPIPGVVFLDARGTVVEIVKGRYPGRPQEDWIIERLRRR